MTWFSALLVAALTVVLTFLVLPVLAIFVDVGPGELLASLDDPAAIDALVLSLQTSVTAVAIILVVGTPAAWFLATRRFRGRELVVTLVELPLVLPPAVAGIGLLAAVGPRGLLAPTISFTLSTAAVVVALTFVAAPFYLRQAQAAFAALDPNTLAASGPSAPARRARCGGSRSPERCRASAPASRSPGAARSASSARP